MEIIKTSIMLSILLLVSCSKTSLGDNVYLERDLNNHQCIVHTSSSCSKIKNGYFAQKVKDFYFQEYYTVFCSNCCYESDVLTLQKGKH